MRDDCRCQFNNPVGANVILPRRDGQVLLARRGVEPFKGSWDTLGGFMQGIESPIESARREFEEETGVTLTEADLTFEGTFSAWGQYKDERYPILHFVYSCELDSTPHAADDVADLAWFPTDALPNVPLDGPRLALERFA